MPCKHKATAYLTGSGLEALTQNAAGPNSLCHMLIGGPNRSTVKAVLPTMQSPAQRLKAQLDKVYELMAITGRRGHQQVVFGEGAFAELLEFVEMAPAGKVTELIYRLSPEVAPLLVAGVYNVLIWSADGEGGVDLDELAEWFYSGNPRKIEITLQVDIFPSNSMEESGRILEEIEKKFPHLRRLTQALRVEVDHRLEEEESWAKYRRDTFEMPKEMTGSIMNIIRHIKKA